VRDGSFFPSLLERALVAVVQEAYVRGISTRRVDELVQAVGWTGISKSQVSRRCRALNAEVERFRTRRLVGSVLAEQHDEWQVGRRYFSGESLAKLWPPPTASAETRPSLVAAS
jgi:hypothetical protein